MHGTMNVKKEEIMLEFEVLSRHNSEGTEENGKNNSDAIPGLWAEILIKHNTQ